MTKTRARTRLHAIIDNATKQLELEEKIDE
jgi:hypothetical protein